MSGASSLDELSDVALSGLQDGQVLAYDTATQKWVNKSVSAGGMDEEALEAYLTENQYAKKGDISIAGLADLHSSWDALLKAQKPTNLAGYGIADGVNDVSVTGSGNVVTSASVSGHVLTLTKGLNAITSVSLATISDLHSSWDAVLKAQKPAWLTTVSLATISDLHASWDALLKAAPSAYVTRWPAWSEVTSKPTWIGANKPSYAFSEITGKPTTLAGYGIADGVNSVSVTGSGNAVTTANVSGHTLTLTKGSTFLLSSAYTAADILAKLKTVDGSGSGLDADLLDGRDSSGFLQYTELGLYEDFVYTVVGLCQISDYTQVGNWSKGEILAQRNNGIYDGSIIKYYIQTRYNSTNSGTTVYFNYTCLGNVGNIKPCTFTYNGKKYAGVVFNSQTASIDKYRISGHKSYRTQPFFVAYLYKKGDTTTVRNAEINNSIVVNGSDLSLNEIVFAAPVLSATTFVRIGSGTITWDATNNCFHFSHGLYSDSFVSAKGANSGSGGTVSGVTKLSDLSDVQLGTLATNQVLSWNGSKWVNKAISTGLDETALAQYLTNNGYATQGWATSQFAYKTGTNATGTWPISITGNAATATKLALQDTRSVNTAPFTGGMGLHYYFKNNTADGMNDGGSFHSVLQFNQWGEQSGGLCKQLALTDGGNMWFRTASSATAWGAWKKLLDSSNYSSIIGNSFVKKAGDTMTGTLTTCTTGTNLYNQGIRINRTALNQWATLTIGYVGTATAGTSANTWLIGTPSSSNSLVFNLNSASFGTLATTALAAGWMRTCWTASSLPDLEEGTR